MSDYITKADLLEASDKILKEDQKHRHALWNKTQEGFNKLDEKSEKHHIEIALLKQNDINMSNNIKELWIKLDKFEDKLEKKIENFFHELPKHFATKAEHTENSNKIAQILDKQSKWDKWFVWFLSIIWWVIVIALLNLIIKGNG